MSFPPVLENTLQQEIQRRSLPENFMQTIENWYLPVAEKIFETANNKTGTFLVSFNGSQGSGKSTITAFLKILLNHQFNLTTVEVSIDDFYLKRQDRLQLAKDIHPLFETRGVPGTHDLKLAVDTLDCLRQCSQQKSCAVPQFDKANDDRKKESEWPVLQQAVDVILFEGWCNHAPVESAQQLEVAINDLENDEDPEAIWRTYSNQQLIKYHRSLFDQADMLIFLQIPSFDKVYEWRGLQEKKLANDTVHKNHAVMNESQLKRFIQHYERVTRSCLRQLPLLADIIIYLNGQHAIESIDFDKEDQHV